jgi:PKHD-type hydroxylase
VNPLHEDNFVSEMLVPKFNRYGVGDAYRSHADAGFMGKRLRTDLACTLFLNDDYEGGELCANGFEVKGEPGVAVVYECWRPHEVRPVTRGERICAITWMQSYIRDSSQREVLGYMRSVMAGINRQTDEERHWAPLTAVYGKLIRMWME